MIHTNLVSLTQSLPEVWRSSKAAHIGNATLKIVKLDDRAHEEEIHAYDEALLVLEGSLHLTINGERRVVRQHELCLIPAGVAHGVIAGSTGCLMIIDAAPSPACPVA